MLGITDNRYKLTNKPQPAQGVAYLGTVHLYQSITELTGKLLQLSDQQVMQRATWFNLKHD